MIVSEKEFHEIVDDFDGFMAENGYVKADVYAKVMHVSPITVRQWVYRGRIPDSLYVGNRIYVKVDSSHPTDLRAQNSGRKKEEEYES